MPLAGFSAVEGALASGFVTAELHLYGAMIVKRAPGPFLISLFDCWRPSPRPDLPSRRPPGVVIVKEWPKVTSLRDLPLTVTSMRVSVIPGQRFR